MSSPYCWGASAASDRVMAQISGLRQSEAVGRLFMVFQAFIDESMSQEGVHVLAGYFSTADEWAKFSARWEALLPTAGRNKDGRPNFHMVDMAKRMDKVVPFFRVIEDHVLGWVSVTVNQRDLRRATRRIQIPGASIDWEKHENTWYMAFRFLMDHFHTKRHLMTEAIPSDAKVDFYFDDRVEKKVVLRMWDNYMNNRPPEVRALYGATPRFEADDDFLPLQAADFWAWHVRRWTADGTPEKIRTLDFSGFTLSSPPKRRYLRIDITVSEDDLVQTLVKRLRQDVPLAIPIVVLPSDAVDP